MHQCMSFWRWTVGACSLTDILKMTLRLQLWAYGPLHLWLSWVKVTSTIRPCDTSYNMRRCHVGQKWNLILICWGKQVMRPCKCLSYLLQLSCANGSCSILWLLKRILNLTNQKSDTNIISRARENMYMIESSIIGHYTTALESSIVLAITKHNLSPKQNYNVTKK